MASRVDELLCGNPIISHSNSPIGATLRSSAIIASGYQWRRRGAQWCTRGAQCAQWYPNGTHRDPRGAQGDPSGAQWDSRGGQWDPTCAERDRRTARLEGKGQGSGLVPGRRVGQGRAQWLGLERGAGAGLAAGIPLKSTKIPKFLNILLNFMKFRHFGVNMLNSTKFAKFH